MTWDEHYATADLGTLELELESLHYYFDDCRDIGQGINTKEVAQEGALLRALARLGVVRERWY